MRLSADSLFSDMSMYAGNISRETNNIGNDSSDSLNSPRKQKQKRSLRYALSRAWVHSKGMLMVIMSQFFRASMYVITQVLERDGSHGKAMHPFQVC